MLVSNQQLLAVCAAALGVVSAFFLCKTVQSRGQVSLAVTIFVLPLLVASGCAILSEIRSIDGALGAFQSISYGHLDVSRLSHVVLKQQSVNNHVSNELIDWMNACPKLENIYFEFGYFSHEDGQALSRLAERKMKYVTFGIGSQLGEPFKNATSSRNGFCDFCFRMQGSCLVVSLRNLDASKH